MTTATKSKLKLSKTDKVLLKMFLENTGSSLCDSGGAYGYHYDRNAKRDLVNEEPAVLEWSDGHPRAIFRTFHWLRKRVEYDAEMQRSFMRFARRKDKWEDLWFNNMQDFVKELVKTQGAEDHGEHNSYNHESALDQVIQFNEFEISGDLFVLLQLHNGCDMRGGHTMPIAFRIDEPGDLNLSADATIACTRRDDPNQKRWIEDSDIQHLWRTDDCYHWRWDGANGSQGGKLDLENFTITTEKYQQYAIFVDEVGVGHCPLCGSPLEVYTR